MRHFVAVDREKRPNFKWLIFKGLKQCAQFFGSAGGSLDRRGFDRVDDRRFTDLSTASGDKLAPGCAA